MKKENIKRQHETEYSIYSKKFFLSIKRNSFANSIFDKLFDIKVVLPNPSKSVIFETIDSFNNELEPFFFQYDSMEYSLDSTNFSEKFQSDKSLLVIFYQGSIIVNSLKTFLVIDKENSKEYLDLDYLINFLRSKLFTHILIILNCPKFKETTSQIITTTTTTTTTEEIILTNSLLESSLFSGISVLSLKSDPLDFLQLFSDMYKRNDDSFTIQDLFQYNNKFDQILDMKLEFIPNKSKRIGLPIFSKSNVLIVRKTQLEYYTKKLSAEQLESKSHNIFDSIIKENNENDSSYFTFQKTTDSNITNNNNLTTNSSITTYSDIINNNFTTESNITNNNNLSSNFLSFSDEYSTSVFQFFSKYHSSYSPIYEFQIEQFATLIPPEHIFFDIVNNYYCMKTIFTDSRNSLSLYLIHYYYTNYDEICQSIQEYEYCNDDGDDNDDDDNNNDDDNKYNEKSQEEQVFKPFLCFQVKSDNISFESVVEYLVDFILGNSLFQFNPFVIRSFLINAIKAPSTILILITNDTNYSFEQQFSCKLVRIAKSNLSRNSGKDDNNYNDDNDNNNNNNYDNDDDDDDDDDNNNNNDNNYFSRGLTESSFLKYINDFFKAEYQFILCMNKLWNYFPETFVLLSNKHYLKTICLFLRNKSFENDTTNLITSENISSDKNFANIACLIFDHLFKHEIKVAFQKSKSLTLFKYYNLDLVQDFVLLLFFYLSQLSNTLETFVINSLYSNFTKNSYFDIFTYLDSLLFKRYSLNHDDDDDEQQVTRKQLQYLDFSIYNKFFKDQTFEKIKKKNNVVQFLKNFSLLVFEKKNLKSKYNVLTNYLSAKFIQVFFNNVDQWIQSKMKDISWIDENISLLLILSSLFEKNNSVLNIIAKNIESFLGTKYDLCLLNNLISKTKHKKKLEKLLDNYYNNCYNNNNNNNDNYNNNNSIEKSTFIDRLDDTDFSLINYCSSQYISFNTLKVLIKQTRDINLQDFNLKTALHHLCFNHEISSDMIQLLLNYNADPSILDSEQNLPVYYAANNFCSNTEIVKKLTLNEEYKLYEEIILFAVGVANYENVVSLSGPCNDLIAMSILFEEMYSLDSKTIIKDGTKAQIMQKLERVVQTFEKRHLTRKNFIFYFSGHGDKQEEDKDNNNDQTFLATSDYDPDNIEKTSITYKEIIQKIQRIPMCQTIMIMDCCFSGGLINNNLHFPLLPLIENSKESCIWAITAGGVQEVKEKMNQNGFYRGVFSMVLEDALKSVKEWKLMKEEHYNKDMIKRQVNITNWIEINNLVREKLVKKGEVYQLTLCSPIILCKSIPIIAASQKDLTLFLA